MQLNGQVSIYNLFIANILSSSEGWTATDVIDNSPWLTHCSAILDLFGGINMFDSSTMITFPATFSGGTAFEISFDLYIT